MREILLAFLLTTAGLAGCIGDETEVSTTGSAPGPTNESLNTTGTAPAATNESLNPWQAGLAESYPTPDVAKHGNASERRSNVAEPGSPAFAGFDATMRAWMETHNVSAGQLALMKDGQLRYERGYGSTDRAGTEPANASTMFRLASVTKPMTAAVVAMQVEQGLYNWTDPVFCLDGTPTATCRLPIDPVPDRQVQDERLAEVQVEDLIAHECGFGPEHDDLLFSPGALEVAETLDIEPPPSAWRSTQFMLGSELTHDPGQAYQYSNVCYMLAGLVAEAATGAELAALYEAYLFEPLEIQADIEPGRTLVDQRNPREPFYPCEYGTVTSVFDPNETVCRPNGSFSMRTQLAYGGLVATAEAVGAVYDAYAEHVPLYPNLHLGDEEVTCPSPTRCLFHTGGMPGTATGAGILDHGGERAIFVYLFNANAGCEDAPVPLPTNCSVGDLLHPMVPLTATWSAGERGGGALGPSALGGAPS